MPTIWLTGLPAAGKTTIATGVVERLIAGGMPAVNIDGDVLRAGLCADLGFSPEDRAENVRRAAHVAVLLDRAGVVAIASLVTPYAALRASARAIHDAAGAGFIEVFVDTPLATCQERDPKGLYARAARGELSGLTGVDDPYERPQAPDLQLTPQSVPEAVEAVLAGLRLGGLSPQSQTS